MTITIPLEHNEKIARLLDYAVFTSPAAKADAEMILSDIARLNPEFKRRVRLEFSEMKREKK